MIELNALRDRYNYLAILYNDKDLQDPIMQMPTYKQLSENEELRENFAKQLKEMGSNNN